MDRRSVSRNWIPLLTLAVLLAAVVAVIIVRLQEAPVPLERDEGEYALMGQLILDGVPPYLEAANMKLPGTYYAYSAILAVFGQTVTGVRIGLMIVNLLSTVFLFLIARRLTGSAGAALAGAAFIILSADTSVLGLFAHATQFVVMFALAGTWLLQESSGSKRRMPILWGAGLCFGLAFLMKQSGAFFALFGFLWLLYGALRQRPIDWKRSLLESATMAGGILIPYAVVLALMAAGGVFGRFWFWTVDYARAYVSQVDLKTGIELFESAIIPIIQSNPVIWSMALAGMIGIWLTRAGREVAPFLLVFFLFSFLAVCPGFYFREHYFVQLLPAVALGAGAALRALEQFVARYTSKSEAVEFAVLVAVVAFSLTGPLSTRHALSKSTPDQFSRAVYGENPFPESVKIAKYLKNNTRPGDRIAVIGSEPQICFYAHRRPATEHIYMYGLMEPEPLALHMQEEMIAQVEKSNPPFLVLVTVSTSWLRRPESEKKLFTWMEGYINHYYRPVMVADIYSDDTLWLVDKEAESFTPGHGDSQLMVFKRKTSE